MDLLISAGMKLYSTASTTCSYVFLIKHTILVSNTDWSIQNSSLATMHKIVTFMAHLPEFSLFQGFQRGGGFTVDEKLIIKGGSSSITKMTGEQTAVKGALE